MLISVLSQKHSGHQKTKEEFKSVSYKLKRRAYLKQLVYGQLMHLQMLLHQPYQIILQNLMHTKLLHSLSHC